MSSSSIASPAADRRRLQRLAAAFALALLALGVAWRYTPLADAVTADAVSGLVQAFAARWWAPLAVIASYTPANLVLFPRPLITLAAVVAFGPWLGFALAMTGILGSAAITYLLGRLLPAHRITRIAGNKSERIAVALKRNGVTAMTALMLVPLAPFAVVALMAGCIRVKLWQFLLATSIAMLPGVLAASVFGNELQAALQDPSRINWAIVAAVVVAMAALTFAVRRWVARTAAADAMRATAA